MAFTEDEMNAENRDFINIREWMQGHDRNKTIFCIRRLIMPVSMGVTKPRRDDVMNKSPYQDGSWNVRERTLLDWGFIGIVNSRGGAQEI